MWASHVVIQYHIVLMLQLFCILSEINGYPCNLMKLYQHSHLQARTCGDVRQGIDAHDDWRWVLPYYDPCQCTSVIYGGWGPNTITPRRLFKPIYVDEPLVTDNVSMIRKHYNFHCMDVEAPVFDSCPADIEMETDPGKATAMVIYQTPNATDNSGDVSVVCTPASESAFNIGKTTVICEARDSSENSVTCNIQVDIKDCQTTVTPNAYIYQYVWPGIPAAATSFTFSVRAASEVHVALSPIHGDAQNMYEIVIGGWRNQDISYSTIRLCKQCTEQTYISTPLILSATEYRKFRVSFENDLVEVSRVGDAPFMSFQNIASIDVKYVGISTAFESEGGSWKFCGDWSFEQVANCPENTTGAEQTGLRVPWQPSVIPFFPFQVRTAGVAKISVEGSGFPGITAFIGMDNSSIYKEVCACGESYASLSCSAAEGGTINVLTALFGRRVTGSVLCPSSPIDASFKTDCDSSWASDLAVTKDLCDGKTSCSVHAINSVFGDPCRHTYKYLRVTYQCTIASGNVYSSPDDVHDVGNDTRILFRNTSGVHVEEVSTNVVNLSDSNYASLYLKVDIDGFHIGYKDQDIFISMQGDFGKSNISSVVLEGYKFCSCEAGPSCTEIVDAHWRIGVCD
ncbi:uncharacterized protein [Amphiura filiformis]|uniref:uncharacterized protein n=1 Tax=Amphiura filiformis TaxID=82378 RepID=UPI003B2240B5